MSERQANGRFATGNAGGPGRPKRAVERDYMAILGDVVTPAEWKVVVSKALSDAQSGDPKARDWLSRYVIGSKPPLQLIEIAASEERRVSSADDTLALAKTQASEAKWAEIALH